MTFRIETGIYKGVHGFNPSGFGMWAFEYKTSVGKQIYSTAPMAYSEAKKEVVKVARANGATRPEIYTLG